MEPREMGAGDVVGGLTMRKRAFCKKFVRNCISVIYGSLGISSWVIFRMFLDVFVVDGWVEDGCAHVATG